MHSHLGAFHTVASVARQAFATVVANLRVFRFTIVSNDMGELVANNVPSVGFSLYNALAGLAITPVTSLANARCLTGRWIGALRILTATTVLRKARIDSRTALCAWGVLEKPDTAFTVKNTRPAVVATFVLATW